MRVTFRSQRRTDALAAIAVMAGLAATAPRVHAAAPLRDAPVVWWEDDRRDITGKPKERDPNLLWDAANESVLRPIGRQLNPVRLGRRVGTLFGGHNVRNASNLNSLGEVPNSSWFTNRIGLVPAFGPEDVARGPGEGLGPSRSAPWEVIRGKSEGVTPGFDIRDASGRVHLVKFDPPGEPGTTSAAAVIAGRILHASGYNVPDDAVVTFQRSDLTLSPKATIKDADGARRAMTQADLDTILTRAERLPDGRWLAVASRFLPGEPLGPFNYKGRRRDDPNDRVNHEDRRELRGLRMIAAWLDHWDTKQGNSLDMLVEEGGRRYVRHHLIDFASTLGAAAGGGAQPRFGYEYTVDFPAIGGRLLALGFHEDGWRRIRRPAGLGEVGYLESREFQPMEWKSLQPNPAFANMNLEDGYWAAKIISAFRDEHIRAAVATGGYRDPAAAEYVTRILAERRDRIARYWFDRVPPLDFFVPRGEILAFRDLGAERALYPGTARYRARFAAVTAGRDAARWSAWTGLQGPGAPIATGAAGDALESAPPSTHPFLAVEVQVARGAEWSRSVTAYVARGSRRVVAVER